MCVFVQAHFIEKYLSTPQVGIEETSTTTKEATLPVNKLVGGLQITYIDDRRRQNIMQMTTKL